MPQELPDDEPGRAFLITAYVVLFLGGAVLGLFGALLLPYSADSTITTTVPTGGSTGAQAAAQLVAAHGGGAGQVLSVGLLFTLIANPLLSWAGMRMAGTRLAGFLPLAGWLLVVLPLATSRATGSVVLPSGARSFAFLLIGALAFTAVAALGRPTRGMSVLLGQPLAKPQPAPAPARHPLAKPQSSDPKSGGARPRSKGGKRR